MVKYLKKNIPIALEFNQFRAYHEFFNSFIDQIIRKNYEDAINKLFHPIPKTRREYLNIKKTVLKNSRIKFTASFVENEIQKWRRMKTIITCFFHRKQLPFFLFSSTELSDIRLISSSINVGTRVLLFNKDHFSLRLGVIDVVNFHDFNYRIEISPVDHDLDKNITYAVAAAGDFMVLDDLEFESIPNISVAFSHDSATSASSTFYDPRLDASHILDSEQDLDRKNLLICMVKTAKLLIIKEMLTSKLTCLNLLSEQEGLFKTTCCLSILVKYAQIVYSIDQTNTKLEALLGKIETLMHSLKSSSLSNVSRSVMISLNKNLTNISTPLFGQIIYLLLSYINEFKTSKDQQKTANETITSELKSLLSLSQQEFLNEFQKNINDIIWF